MHRRPSTCFRHRPGAAPRAVLIALALLLVLGLAGWKLLRPKRAALVVYCAHDLEFSEPVLKAFEERTGIPVVIVPDTEASKSLGLVQRLLAEKDQPRCDVFWNNEQLGTMELAEAGVLEAHQGEGWSRMPAEHRDPKGLWTGFAARMRVWIVNTQAMPPTIEAVGAAADAENLSRVAIARPLYGTTRTHYTVLWHLWGGDTVQAWHEDLRRRGIIELPGNGPVKNHVAAGTCHLGLTDTDDFFAAIDERKPVAMVPVQLTNGKTIVIPNTVALIRGTPRGDDARKLVDFLLSAEVELMLANSRSRQIPLGPVDEDRLSDEVKQLRKLAGDGYPLSNLAAAAKECLRWLQREYVK